MLFVTAGSDREKLKELSRLLLSAFPGSVIYQYTDPSRVSGIVFEHRVDAVFADRNMEKLDGVELERLLHRRRPELPVFLLSDTDAARSAPSGDRMTFCLTRPVSAEDLQKRLARRQELRV